MQTTRIPLPPPKSAEELLEMYYLEIRCNLLEAAAGFDRIQRARGSDKIANDARLQRLQEAIDVLKRETPDRAETFLNLFSE